MEKNSQSRFQNTWKNFRFGVAAQIVISLLGFLSRTIFIHVLSEEYLGINGLYASILNVLSLTELGLSDIVVYSLYKPLAQGDEKQLTALMGYYKTIYRIIALAVAVIGLGLVPVLRLLVKSTIDQYHLVLYYLMFLANSVCSYLLVYKSSIIHADQKRYLISRYEICFKFLSVAAQIMVLLLFRNFTVYLFIQIAMTVVSNLFISRKADQLYPFLKEKAPLEPETKKNIFRDVRHMFSYKAGGQLLNSTDNLYISTLISTATVGQYDNYVMIQGMVSAYTTIISQSVLGSLGNLNATGDRAQKKRVFDIYSMGFSWIAAFCTASLLVLYNPFILLWAGEKWLLPMDTVAVICLNFFLPNVLVPVWNFRNTSGLFRETKNILLYAAAINLVLSYFLGVKWGLTGILAATSISRLLTSFWFEPYILHKKIFETSCAPFFLRQGACLGIVVLSFAAITLVSSLCGLGVWGDFFLRGVLCLVIPNGLLLALNFRTEAFGYLKEKLLKSSEADMRSQKLLETYAGDILHSKGMDMEKRFFQHGTVTVFDHSVAVALMCLQLAALLRLRTDTRSLVRGALLHDYFLYDWHIKEKGRPLHGTHHARRAMKNAERDFGLNKIERNMILAHMFPLNLTLPRYRESVLLCTADKLCALRETARGVLHR